METSYQSFETIEQFCSVPRTSLYECNWDKQTQRDYLNSLKHEKILTPFYVCKRQEDEWILDGNNRAFALMQYMEGSDGLYIRVGSDKVLYCVRGYLKPGYRLMTKNECKKFLSTVLTLKFCEVEHSNKKARIEDLPESL